MDPTSTVTEHVVPTDPVPVSSADATGLDRSLVSGLGWTAGAKWLTQLLTWPATLIVAHLLAPSDFGLLAMAAVFMGLVSLLNEFGLGSAIVNRRDLSANQIAQINTLCVLFGCVGAIVCLVAAYPLSLLYRTPALVWVIFSLSGSLLITGFRTVPLSLMQRDFQFRGSALNESIGGIVQSGTVVLFVWLGFKYWSLVLSSLLSSLVMTALIFAQRPHAFAWPRRRDVADAVEFGSHFVGARLAWYLYTNADFFVVGRVLGPAALGSYSLGWEFATLPVEKVTALIGRVSPPVFSAVRDDPVALRRYLIRLTSGIGLLTFPAGVGLALVSNDLVRFALGDKWLPAVVPLQILSIYAAFRSIMPLIAQVGNAVGLNRFVMRNSVAAALLLPIAFLIGSHWGTSGVAFAWVVAYPLVAVPLCAVVFRRIGMTMREFMSALWPAVSSAALLVPVVLVTRETLPGAWSPALRLSMEVGAGVITYGLTVWGLHRDAIRTLLDIVPRRNSGPVREIVTPAVTTGKPKGVLP